MKRMSGSDGVGNLQIDTAYMISDTVIYCAAFDELYMNAGGQYHTKIQEEKSDKKKRVFFFLAFVLLYRRVCFC